MKHLKLFEAYQNDTHKNDTHKKNTPRKSNAKAYNLDDIDEDGELNVSYNELTSILELPKNLLLLNCAFNFLESLPILPESLVELWCGPNYLTSLSPRDAVGIPKLPDGLKRLDCHKNKLTSLPELPDGLEILNCHDNKLTSLPELPENLMLLYCHNNPLECLIPTKFVRQDVTWLIEYYYPYIISYEGQKNILTKQPHMVKQLEEQTKILQSNPVGISQSDAVGILPEIKKEFAHLFTGNELNLI